MYTGSDRPLLKDLLKHVVYGIAHKWKAIGVQLLPYEAHAGLDAIMGFK